MAAKTVTYANWDAGDWGRMGPEKAPKNAFSGLNVLPYRTGELGVRPGVRLTNPTGMANGSVWGMGRLPLNAGSIWYGQGNAIKYFQPLGLGAVSTATNTLTGTPTSVTFDETGATTFLATTTENGYSFNGATITQLTNMPDAQSIAVYGDRLAVVPVSAKNTVVFSAAASYNNWTISAGNAVSVTVGDTDEITAIYAQRGHLAILKRYSGLWVLTGTPGTNEALRQVARFNGPANHQASGRTRSDDRIWFSPSASQYMAAFDGASVQSIDDYPPPLYDGIAARSVVTLKDDDQAGLAFVIPPDHSGSLVYDNEVWVRYNGAWTRHSFGVQFRQHVTTILAGYCQDGSSALSNIRFGTGMVFGDFGAGVNPSFWTWMPFMDRPGLEADPLGTGTGERAGDVSTTAVTGSFDLPHFVDPDGNEVMVTGVRVEFRSWNNGASDNTQFTAQVRAIREYEGDYVDSSTQTWSAAPSSSALAGTYRRAEFGFGDQGFGSGFQIKVSGMKGVAIRRIVVSYETRPPR